MVLHLEQLLLGVGIIRDVDEVLDLGWVDLLILASNEQCSYSNQLEARLINFHSFEKSIDNVNCDKEGFME